MSWPSKHISRVADILQVVTFFGFSAAALVKHAQTGSAAIVISLLIIGLLSLFTLIERHRKNKKVSAKFNTSHIELRNADIMSSFPSDEQLDSMFKCLNEARLEWDRGSKIRSYDVSVSFRKGNVIMSSSISAVSEWKKSEAIFSLPIISPNYHPQVHTYKLQDGYVYEFKTNKKPFYKNYRNWRRAVQIIYGQYEDMPKDTLTFDFGDYFGKKQLFSLNVSVRTVERQFYTWCYTLSKDTLKRISTSNIPEPVSRPKFDR